MFFRKATSVYSEGHIINIQLQCVWQNGEFRNDAAPGFQWLTHQQQSFLYALLHYSDCQKIHNPRQSNTQDVTVNYSSPD